MFHYQNVNLKRSWEDKFAPCSSRSPQPTYLYCTASCFCTYLVPLVASVLGFSFGCCYTRSCAKDMFQSSKIKAYFNRSCRGKYYICTYIAASVANHAIKAYPICESCRLPKCPKICISHWWLFGSREGVPAVVCRHSSPFYQVPTDHTCCCPMSKVYHHLEQKTHTSTTQRKSSSDIPRAGHGAEKNI